MRLAYRSCCNKFPQTAWRVTQRECGSSRCWARSPKPGCPRDASPPGGTGGPSLPLVPDTVASAWGLLRLPVTFPGSPLPPASNLCRPRVLWSRDPGPTRMILGARPPKVSVVRSAEAAFPTKAPSAGPGIRSGRAVGRRQGAGVL